MDGYIKVYTMPPTFALPWIKTTVNISPELYELCKKHRIRFSDAIRVGISISLAEIGVLEYSNKLNIVRLLDEYKRKAGEYAQKAADLENGDVKP